MADGTAACICGASNRPGPLPPPLPPELAERRTKSSRKRQRLRLGLAAVAVLAIAVAGISLARYQDTVERERILAAEPAGTIAFDTLLRNRDAYIGEVWTVEGEILFVHPDGSVTGSVPGGGWASLDFNAPPPMALEKGDVIRVTCWVSPARSSGRFLPETVILEYCRDAEILASP